MQQLSNPWDDTRASTITKPLHAETWKYSYTCSHSSTLKQSGSSFLAEYNGSFILDEINFISFAFNIVIFHVIFYIDHNVVSGLQQLTTMSLT